MSKMKTLGLMLLATIWAHQACAQTAQVQFIHNSPDVEIETVDIYVDDVLFWDDLSLHYATPFLDVTADIDVVWAIAPANSTSADEAILTSSQIFTENELAVVIMNGVAAASGYTPLQPLSLSVKHGASLAANQSNQIDLLMAHGSTDLPQVQWTWSGSTLQTPLPYGQIGASYISLDEDNYVLEMRDISNNLIDHFEAPLADFGLVGSAAVAVLAGFNEPTLNFMGAPLGLWLALPDGGMLIECPIYIPPVYTQAQLIHASADPTLEVIDIYIDDELWLDDFTYLTASPFIDIQALVDVEMLIAPGNSQSADEAIGTIVVNLLDQSDYVLTLSGNLQGDGYYPYAPLSIQAFEGAISNSTPGLSVDLIFVQASTDFPTSQLQESQLLMIPLIEEFSYGTVEGYLNIIYADYELSLVDPMSGAVWASFQMPLTSLALGASTATIVAAGYLNAAANQMGSSFGMYLALEDGGALIPLTFMQSPALAEVQVLHNSPDPTLATIDVYINHAKWIDDLSFRNSSPMLNLPVLGSAVIGITPGSAFDDSSATEWTYDWTDASRVSLVLNGLMEGSTYNPNLPLSLTECSNSLSTMDPDESSFRVVNGSTDGPTFDLQYTTDGSVWVDNLSYGQASEYWTTENIDLTMDLTTSNGENVLANYGLPVVTWGLAGQSHLIVASGFYNPDNNNQGPEYGFWMSSEAGGEWIPLPQEIIPLYEARAQFIHNVADVTAQQLDIYMNGVLIADDLDFRSATPFITVPAEVQVTFGVAPANSDGPEDAFMFLNRIFQADEIHYAVFHGMLSGVGYNPQQSLELSVFEGAREEAVNPNQCDIICYHGSTDTPTMDISELTLPITGMVDNLMYDGWGGFVSFEAFDDYGISLTTLNGISLGEYALPVGMNNWAGRSVLVLASGFLNPGNNNQGDEFALYAIFSDGSSVELSPYVNITESEPVVDLSVYPNPASTVLNWSIELDKAQNLNVELIDINGKVVFLERNLSCGLSMTRSIDVSSLPEGYYFLRIQNRQLATTIGFGLIK
jgi:hypothetical protein